MKLSKLFITAIISALFVSCGTKWNTDYDDALKSAQKKNKDVFLVFTGDDWTDNSVPFKENILNKKEFLSRYSKDYVFLNIDFSQGEFAKTKVAEDASDADKKLAEKIAAEYKRKEVLGRNYSVKVWPAVYLCSAEGYVLEQVIFDADKDTTCTVEEYSEKVEVQRKKAAEIKVLVEAVRSAKGVEKAKAIDELVKGSNPRFSDLYKDLIYEFPALDTENETGRLGFYELAAAYYVSYEATTKNEDPAKPFLDVIEKGHLALDQVQEAYYMAAYSLINGEKFDSALVTEYLEKAYTVNPAGPNAMKILQNLQQMKRFSELEKVQAESDGE
ncbi:thioredoxin family protein [Treponema sp.]|uniref:thioredoxin family protein n=1 Tax=Treponema sp. TaxID=166 RepID=UPI00298E79A7|nr:thioredoxin family protein [Treponema sp.]MCQ2241714.1 thioredoxin family protein [Treponema sp.]